MAKGIPLGSSFRYTSSVPTNLNAYHATAAARKAAGQVRHTSWAYFQEDAGSEWRILPLAQCLVNGTPATNGGTWGTLDAHWTAAGASATPGNGGGSGVTVQTFIYLVPAFSAGTVLTVSLPDDVVRKLQLTVSQPQPYGYADMERVVARKYWALSSDHTQLLIQPPAGVREGDELWFEYITGSPVTPADPTSNYATDYATDYA